jgi:hypothetical protein
MRVLAETLGIRSYTRSVAWRCQLHYHATRVRRRLEVGGGCTGAVSKLFHCSKFEGSISRSDLNLPISRGCFLRFRALLVNFDPFFRSIFPFFTFSGLSDTVYSHARVDPVLLVMRKRLSSRASVRIEMSKIFILGTFSARKLHSYGRYFTLQFQRAGPDTVAAWRRDGTLR